MKTRSCSLAIAWPLFASARMRRIIFGLWLPLLFSVTAPAQPKSAEPPCLTGPYLGQNPPGATAELFAPGVVSTGRFEHSSPVFTPDLGEIYWSTIIEENGETVSRPTYYMKRSNGGWSEPRIPSFGNGFKSCEYPFISADGKRLFFSGSHVLPLKNIDLFYVNRVGDNWSAPIALAAPINTPDHNEAQLTVAKDGTIYFIGFCEKARTGFGLYAAEPGSGCFQIPVFMAEKFNSLQVDWTPYVAPDESYFIFCSFREGGFGSGDLYICFRQKDGSWGEVINMGNTINSQANERFPNVTPDGKYLFFNSTRKIPGADPNGPGNGKGDIYWVGAGIIKELRKRDDVTTMDSGKELR